MSISEREAIHAALAYVRWTAFGECRTNGWDGPTPTAAEVNTLLVAALEPPECKRDPRTKLVGDGCSIFNPKLAAELAAEVEPVACTKCNGLGYYDEGHENDDGTMSGGNYVECDKCHPALAKREHITTGEPCWCNPETTYKDPKTGVKVIVHKEPM